MWLRFPPSLRSLTPSDQTVVRLCAQSVSRVQPFATSWTIHSPLGFSQARVLEWVAISFSRGSFLLRDWTHISSVFCVGRQILYHWATWEACSQILKPQETWLMAYFEVISLEILYYCQLQERLGSSIVLEIWSQRQTSIHKRLNIDLTKKRKKIMFKCLFSFLSTNQ